MALLLAAQRSKHNCAWKKYFDKIGKRMMSQYYKVSEEEE